jgi:hypothetical protein
MRPAPQLSVGFYQTKPAVVTRGTRTFVRWLNLQGKKTKHFEQVSHFYVCDF